MKAYNSKTPILTRSGSAPRTICFTQSSSKRSFDYQQPFKTNAIIQGNLMKRVNIKESQEEKVFRKVSKKDEPNTSRMLVPEYLPENKEKNFIRNNSTNNVYTNPNIRPGSINALIYRSDSKSDLMVNRKATNPRVYQSFNFLESEPEKPLTRNLKGVEFKKYDHTTQITTLPGGVKRDINEIRDDRKPKILKNNESYSVKVNRDFNSNVSCLPGPLTVKSNTQKCPSPSKYRKNQSNDFIFNNYSSNVNSFNTSNKKIVNRYVQESTKEKPLVPYHKASRPDQIRNVFASQISIV